MPLNDPTYDRKEINKNPEWLIAFILSEMKNDNAPINWSGWLPEAKEILRELKKHKHL